MHRHYPLLCIQPTYEELKLQQDWINEYGVPVYPAYL